MYNQWRKQKIKLESWPLNLKRANEKEEEKEEGSEGVFQKKLEQETSDEVQEKPIRRLWRKGQKRCVFVCGKDFGCLYPLWEIDQFCSNKICRLTCLLLMESFSLSLKEIHLYFVLAQLN